MAEAQQGMQAQGSGVCGGKRGPVKVGYEEEATAPVPGTSGAAGLPQGKTPHDWMKPPQAADGGKGSKGKGKKGAHEGHMGHHADAGAEERLRRDKPLHGLVKPQGTAGTAWFTGGGEGGHCGGQQPAAGASMSGSCVYPWSQPGWGPGQNVQQTQQLYNAGPGMSNQNKATGMQGMKPDGPWGGQQQHTFAGQGSLGVPGYGMYGGPNSMQQLGSAPSHGPQQPAMQAGWQQQTQNVQGSNGHQPSRTNGQPAGNQGYSGDGVAGTAAARQPFTPVNSNTQPQPQTQQTQAYQKPGEGPCPGGTTQQATQGAQPWGTQCQQGAATQPWREGQPQQQQMPPQQQHVGNNWQQQQQAEAGMTPPPWQQGTQQDCQQHAPPNTQQQHASQQQACPPNGSTQWQAQAQQGPTSWRQQDQGQQQQQPYHPPQQQQWQKSDGFVCSQQPTQSGPSQQVQQPQWQQPAQWQPSTLQSGAPQQAGSRHQAWNQQQGITGSWTAQQQAMPPPPQQQQQQTPPPRAAQFAPHQQRTQPNLHQSQVPQAQQSWQQGTQQQPPNGPPGYHHNQQSQHPHQQQEQQQQQSGAWPAAGDATPANMRSAASRTPSNTPGPVPSPVLGHGNGHTPVPVYGRGSNIGTASGPSPAGPR